MQFAVALVAQTVRGVLFRLAAVAALDELHITASFAVIATSAQLVRGLRHRAPAFCAHDITGSIRTLVAGVAPTVSCVRFHLTAVAALDQPARISSLVTSAAQSTRTERHRSATITAHTQLSHDTQPTLTEQQQPGNSTRRLLRHSSAKCQSARLIPHSRTDWHHVAGERVPSQIIPSSD